MNSLPCSFTASPARCSAVPTPGAAVAELAGVLGHLLRELRHVLDARAGGGHQHQRLGGTRPMAVKS